MVLKQQTEITSMPLTLLSCIEKRESELLGNEVIIAAIFLDPRFRRTLTPAQKDTARQHLKMLAKQLIMAKELSNTSIETSSEVLAEQSTYDSVINESTNHSTASLLRESLADFEMESSSEEEEDTLSSELLSDNNERDGYKPKRLDVEADLLKYWEEKNKIFHICES